MFDAFVEARDDSEFAGRLAEIGENLARARTEYLRDRPRRRADRAGDEHAMTGDSGLAFWLSYVESRGGLWESAGDAAMVMIPPQLQHRLELPEEFAVTEHPDVAREDGVALLGAGHPLLAAAAEDVLAADDAGVLTLAQPASQPPDDHRLLAKARDQFPVDHGRIDASGAASAGCGRCCGSACW